MKIGYNEKTNRYFLGDLTIHEFAVICGATKTILELNESCCGELSSTHKDVINEIQKGFDKLVDMKKANLER